jgi:hypothetical protein
MLPSDDVFVIFFKYAILYIYIQLAAIWLICPCKAEGCPNLWTEWDTDPLQYYSTIYAWASQVVHSLQTLLLKFCIHFIGLPCKKIYIYKKKGMAQRFYK